MLRDYHVFALCKVRTYRVVCGGDKRKERPDRETKRTGGGDYFFSIHLVRRVNGHRPSGSALPERCGAGRFRRELPVQCVANVIGRGDRRAPIRFDRFRAAYAYHFLFALPVGRPCNLCTASGWSPTIVDESVNWVRFLMDFQIV